MSDLVIEQITLEKANLIIKNAIDKAREIKINPIMVVLLDHRGAIKACSGEDGISSLRFQIAHGKANGAFQMGMGSRALFNRAEQQAYFINAVNTLTDGALVAVPGGVLIRDKNNETKMISKNRKFFFIINKIIMYKTMKKHKDSINDFIYYKESLLDKRTYNLMNFMIDMTVDNLKMLKKNKENVVNLEENMDFKIDDILDKINKIGYLNLTDKEKEFLNNYN